VFEKAKRIAGVRRKAKRMAAREPEVDVDPKELPLSAEQAWAMEKFEELGFSPFTASVLAMMRADWHRAKRLLRQAESLGDKAHDFVYDQLT
jgi:hypothetical protein